MNLPPLYAILDAETLRKRGIDLLAFAAELKAAGVTLLQYRDKTSTDEEMVAVADQISELFAETEATLILNDRLDVALLAQWSGVHVGQGDTPPDEARIILGDGRIIGLSTHGDDQVKAADSTVADYIAVGPVFATATKADAEPAVGLEGVRRARALTNKPLVAIGGITPANAQEVLDAGADCVAMISGLLEPAMRTRDLAADLLGRLRVRRLRDNSINLR